MEYPLAATLSALTFTVSMLFLDLNLVPWPRMRMPSSMEPPASAILSQMMSVSVNDFSKAEAIDTVTSFPSTMTFPDSGFAVRPSFSGMSSLVRVPSAM